jgi:hypothetical protein
MSRPAAGRRSRGNNETRGTAWLQPPGSGRPACLARRPRGGAHLGCGIWQQLHRCPEVGLRTLQLTQRCTGRPHAGDAPVWGGGERQVRAGVAFGGNRLGHPGRQFASRRAARLPRQGTLAASTEPRTMAQHDATDVDPSSGSRPCRPCRRARCGAGPSKAQRSAPRQRTRQGLAPALDKVCRQGVQLGRRSKVGHGTCRGSLG